LVVELVFLLCGGCETRWGFVEGPMSLLDDRGADRLRVGLRPRPQQAGLRTNIRFKFQAMVTRLHSPRTFSRPRREN
jgi:hypothetical protein